MNFSELVETLANLDENAEKIDKKIVDLADLMFDILSNDVCQDDIQRVLSVVRGITGLVTKLKKDSMAMNTLLFIRSELFNVETGTPEEQEEVIKSMLRLMEYAFYPLS